MSRDTSSGIGSPGLHAERRRVDDDVEPARVVRSERNLQSRIVLPEPARRGPPSPRRRRRRARSRPAPAAAAEAAIAEPTPPEPTTSSLLPLSEPPLCATPRTKPSPSNMSPISRPSVVAAHRVARARDLHRGRDLVEEGDDRDLVRHGDQRAVEIGEAADFRKGAAEVLAPDAERHDGGVDSALARTTDCRSSAT